MFDLLASLPPQSDFFGTIIYIIQSYYKIILYGLGVTILLSVVGTLGGFILAMGVTQARVVVVDKKRDPVYIKVFKVIFKQLSIMYVTVFRGTPMIVQAMIIYYGVATTGVFPWWGPLPAGLIIVTINTTAYISEVLRGGLQRSTQDKWRPLER
ncbi:ABC transporter permease subunit [Acholeplasma vituli]|uniref:ABC transporter permease subunit n=1 Tax=Paracholeplasma vituli TaxID=69473 RepID=A0ABT2PXZ1_9MOLU|nr:ABC transporter permease subunit [Paracholeplasma vituli]MCU0104513.1 ABC transporter permease subunit [Paracholeplasma vituli]